MWEIDNLNLSLKEELQSHGEGHGWNRRSMIPALCITL